MTVLFVGALSVLLDNLEVHLGHSVALLNAFNACQTSRFPSCPSICPFPAHRPLRLAGHCLCRDPLDLPSILGFFLTDT